MKTYKKILLPLDFSKNSAYAAERAKELAQFYGAELCVLHIIDYIPPIYVAAEIPAELSSEKKLTAKAQAHLDEWTNDHGLTDCPRMVEIGQPRKIIPKLIKDMNFDLVLLTPNDDNVIVRFFGSVSNAVAQHSDCDVLILRN